MSLTTSQYCTCSPPNDKVCTKCSPSCNMKCVDDEERDLYKSLKDNVGVDDACCGKGYCGVKGGFQGVNKREHTPDKLMFVIEWYDNGSDLIKKYLLIYYTVDGTCEIKDLINHQRFLRRLKLDTIKFPELFIGNVVNIYGRKMTLVDYADSCSRIYLEKRTGKGFLLVKPHAVECLGTILQGLEKNGFRIVRGKMVKMGEELVAKLYEQYRSEEFYLHLLSHMTSGPVVALLLVSENAVSRLLYYVGPTDPAIAKLTDPMSLRGIYGVNTVLNAVEVSESPECVAHDSSLFFTNHRPNLPFLPFSPATLKCSTLCLIKPHALREKLAGPIIDSIMKGGFKITGMELFYLDRTHAEELYEIYKGVYPEYGAMTAELSLGPCYALEVSGKGEDTPFLFREYCGPYDPAIARILYPTTLRARFGTDKVHNAIHCSDLKEDAETELDYFFRILQMV